MMINDFLFTGILLITVILGIQAVISLIYIFKKEREENKNDD